MKTPDSASSNQPPKKSVAADLLNSEIFGMWADRTDIDDSAEFARSLRRRAWQRGVSPEEDSQP